MRGHRVWAEIDLPALRRNITVVRREVGPSTRIMAVVKADAYGHGAVPVAWHALQSGCDALGVGDSTEALQLRESGIAGPILILGAIIEEEIPKVVEADVAVSVHSPDLLDLLDREARRQHRLLRVHLKIDTGMGRLGASPQRAPEIAREIAARPNLDLEGLCTHLSSVVSGNGAHTREQLDRFHQAIADLAALGIRPPVIHAANSAGMLMFREAHFDMVRTGITLYGLDPGIFAKLNLDLTPILSLKTRIAFLKGVPAGTPISYDQVHRTERATRIATCPVGYNDGYPRLLTNRASALLRGRRVPVVGTITMDYIMLDVGDLPEAAVGDEVTLIGRDGLEEIRCEELAKTIGTIPYELTCGLGRRVKRIYVEEPAAAQLASGTRPSLRVSGSSPSLPQPARRPA
ncbi:MAG TPA: alanine racemase [Planctomycetota bacterium]|nr:alanine racemase [Planctomycetota bacterium]